MTVLMRFVLASVLVFALGTGQALAVGEDDDAAAAKPNSDYAKAVKHVKAGNYGAAIPLFQKALEADPTSANAHNYLGYSHRKLGDKESALSHYLSALKLEPEHRGANEYLGELYLEMGQLDKAKERLEVLDDACFFGCAEYRELKAKIKEYQPKAGS